MNKTKIQFFFLEWTQKELYEVLWAIGICWVLIPILYHGLEAIGIPGDPFDWRAFWLAQSTVFCGWGGFWGYSQYYLRSSFISDEKIKEVTPKNG